MRLADHYVAFLLLNVVDLLLTGVYFRMGGREANRVAAWVLQTFELRGLVIYKFALVVVVVAACEAVFVRREQLARALIVAGCAVFTIVIVLQLRGLVFLAAAPAP